MTHHAGPPGGMHADADTGADTDFAMHFVRAVDAWRDGAPPDAQTFAGLAMPAFAIYANTGLRACIEALQAAYPSVLSLVGEPGFEQLAARYARLHPPQDARLFLYGEGFAAYLRAVEAQSEWPYLADLADIDRCRSEAHAALDAPVMTSSQLTFLPADMLGATVLTLAPSTRWHHSTTSPVLDLWALARQRELVPQPLVWRAQAVLVTRPDDEVLMHELPPAGIALLQSCAQQLPLSAAVAAAQATAADADIDLRALLETLFAQGAFKALAPHPHPLTTRTPELP